MLRAIVAALTGLSIGVLGVAAVPAAGAVASVASTTDARFDKTVWKAWNLSAFQTINGQTVSCPANFRLDDTDYSPGRGVPRGVEVQELGGIGVTAVSLNDAAGNSVGATGISMTNWNFESHNVKILLHCWLPETPAKTPAQDGRVNLPYEFVYDGVRWGNAQITEGELPPGLRMDEFGKITGTPTKAGAFRYKVYWEHAEGSFYHSEMIYIAEHTADRAAEIPAAAGVAMAPNAAADTADVLGLGYEQVIQLNGNTVEIREPQNRGGAVIRSFGTSIDAMVDDGYRAPGQDFSWLPEPVWQFDALVAMNDPSSRVVAGDGDIFVLGPSSDGTCDSFACPEPPSHELLRYSTDGALLAKRIFSPSAFPTAVDFASHAGRNYLSVGLTFGGVRILDSRTLEDVNALHTDWTREGVVPYAIDVATVVGLRSVPVGDGNRLVSVAGRWTDNAYNLSVSDALSGELLWNYNWHDTLQDRVVPDVVQFGEYGPNGEVAVAVGWWKQNRVTILDAATGGELSVVSGDSKATGLRFFRDLDGQRMFAIQREGTSSVGSLDVAGNWTKTMDILTADGDVSSARLAKYFAPGYQAGTVKVANAAAGAVSVKFFSSRAGETGCWIGSEFAGAKPWPSLPFTVAPAAVSARYGTGHLTGTSACARERGVFFAEVTAPDGGSRQIVKIGSDINESWKLVVLESAGENQYAITLTQQDDEGSVLGDWELKVTDQFTTPSAVTAPTISGARLTPAPVDGYKPTANVDDPSRPVYRFTVSGAQWDIPGAAQRANVTLPAMTVEGSPDGGTTWTPLGVLVPQAGPAREGDRVTLGTASFDWQTTYGGTDYTQFRVLSGGTVSNVVSSALLEAPASLNSGEVNGLKLSVDATSAYMIRTNGLDQVPFQYYLTGTANSQVLDPNDPRYSPWYDRVYFRESTTSKLVTGLGSTTNPGQMVSVTYERGQYANDGVTSAATSRAAYIATNDVTGRVVKAVFKASGKDINTWSSGNLNLARNKTTLTTQGFGTDGLLVSGCPETACDLQAATESSPALYSAGEDTIGMQLNRTAVTGSGALPLGSAGKHAAEQPIITDVMRISSGRAYLGDPARFGFIGLFSTDLISHGERVPVINAYVKNKEQG